jgi:DnaJ-class molecular chaperone
MDFTKDYYKILGIVPGTQYEQIRSAYRVLAKKYHPDLHPHDTECVECIKEINEAWEVLGNSDNRFIYDTFKINTRRRTEAGQISNKGLVKAIRELPGRSPVPGRRPTPKNNGWHMKRDIMSAVNCESNTGAFRMII